MERIVYKTNKIVEVEEMSRLEYVLSRGWTLPEDENHLKDERVFKVYYKDGYISMCPKDKFLEDAKPLNEEFTFGEAVELLKKGYKVSRKGWNGKGMFVVYQKGYPNGISANKNTAEAWRINEGDLFKVNPYLQIKNVNGSHSMWVPSINDCLSEDWEVVV